ncbi:MAG: PAS domain S-box protein, partial [Candidatus Thermoplasmatota archaeon]
MLSKVDESEIYADLNLTALIITGFTLLLIIICGIGLAFIYNSHQKTIYKELYSKEKELWGQQEKFKVTMDNLGEGIITLDVNGKVQYMNKLAEEMTGWNLREARGRDLHEIYPIKNEKTGQRENNILDKIYKQGKIKELANHTILITKTGKEIPVMDTGAPIYDTDGSILGIVIVFQDETEKRRQQKLLAESEARYRNLVENSLVGIFETTTEGKALYGNKALIDMFGFKSLEEFKSTPMVMNYKNPKRREELIAELKQHGKVDNFEVEMVSRDGRELYILLNAKLTGNVLTGMVVDVSDRKLAEEEIKRANRVFAVLSNINQTIVRIKDKQTLYDEMCRIAVEDGKFKMAWIGMLDEHTNKILPVAAAGDAKDYIKTIDIDLSDPVLGNGPTGRCIRTGKHYLANDIANNPEMVPWRENALKFGFKSSAAFP